MARPFCDSHHGGKLKVYVERWMSADIQLVRADQRGWAEPQSYFSSFQQTVLSNT